MTILVADAGGTHIRFAVSHDGRTLSEPQKFKVSEFPSLKDAVTHYLFRERIEYDNIRQFAYALAGRNPWGKEQAGDVFPSAATILINDFEANAHGLIDAAPDDLVCLSGRQDTKAPLGASRAIIGSGTGVGIAYIIPVEAGHHVQRTHGAHMLPTLLRPEHLAILENIRALEPKANAPIYEDLLAGYGIFDIYRALTSHGHIDVDYKDTNDMIARGRDDPFVQQTLKLYHGILGVFAHQVLAFGYAYDGLYLTGGITDRLIGAGLFDLDTFLAELNQKMVPIVARDVAATPVYWVKDEFISLRGLLRLAHGKA